MILQNILKIKCVEIRKKSERLGKIREIRKKSRRSEDPDKNWETLQLSGRVGRSAIRQRIGEVQSLKPAFHIFFRWKKKSIKNQVRKKYGGCSTYFSPKHKEISSGCCGPFYVGRWTVDNTVVHFQGFMRKASFNQSFMLRLRIDNPIIN